MGLLCGKLKGSAVQASRRGQKQETVSGARKQQMQEYRERSQARDCQWSRLLLGKRLLSSHHRSSPVAAPRPRGAVVRRCPGAVRSHPSPDPGRSVGPGFLTRARGRNETETCRTFFCIAVVWGVAVVQGRTFVVGLKTPANMSSISATRICI